MTTPTPPSEPGEMAHTGERWTVELYGDGDSLVIHSGPDERVCFMATPGESPGAMERIERNARLIAAAPDMAEAIAAHLAARDALADAAVTSLHPDDPRFAEVARTLALLRAALSRALKDQTGASDE